MQRPDRFDEHPGLGDELPELPIPRPGEGLPERPVTGAPVAQPLGPAPLGGGASFTAAREGDAPPEAAPGARSVAPGHESDPRFTWEIAARLTAGMLANPARSASSVKDAMAMFDQFLQEVHAYERVASSSELSVEDGLRRRREHGEYFQSAQHRGEGDAVASDGAASQLPPRPQPTQPAPMGGFQPLPPHMRAPYMPDGPGRRPFGEPMPNPDAA